MSLLLVTSTLAACEREAESTADPPESPAEKAVEQPETSDEPDDEPDPASKPGPKPPPERTPEPLVDALEAPEGVGTKAGRFDTLMERGLAEHMPEIGILYGAAGVDEPGVRVAVAADGRGRWARGDGPYHGELEHSGDFELGEEEAAEAAKIIESAWTAKVDYPPSSVKQTRVLILRDGETVRVFEHSALPPSLARLEDMLRAHLPAKAPE